MRAEKRRDAMGLMIDGKWVDDDRISADARGHFIRADSRFRHWITAEGSAGPSGERGLKAEVGRYNLFVSPSFPGARRDLNRHTNVNNESSEIIRMFNAAFGAFTDVHYDFYPEDLRGEIDRINDFVYSHFNNGVYRAGFARSQEAYDEAVRQG